MLAVYGAGRGEDDFVSLLCQDFWQISQNSGHLFCLQLSLSQWPELVFKHNHFSPKSWWGSPFSSKRMNVTRAKNMLLCLHTFTFTMTGSCLQRELACPLCEFDTDILIHWSMWEGLKFNSLKLVSKFSNSSILPIWSFFLLISNSCSGAVWMV